MQELMPYQTAIQNAEERFRKVSEQLSYDKESIFAMQQLTKTDFAMATANKNPRSVILALHNLAATGLTLNPAYGYAYLVPRDGSIVLDISYKGLLKIATDTGSIAWGRADVVYEADEFIYHGPAGAPTHKNHNPFRKDKGEIVGVYCIAKTKEGDILTEIMDRDEIEKIRSKSSAYSRTKNGQHTPSGPWVDWFNQMAKKAIIKRAQNTWPKTETSERLQDAIQIANESEGGYNLESDEEKAHKRQQQHDAALGRWYKSVDFIKHELEKEEPDMYTIAEAWGEIPQHDQMALWLAPTKGGIFSTAEREALKTKLPAIQLEQAQ